MKNIHYPLHFNFKISTISNDFVVKDADELPLFFVRQKLFKFIEEVNVFKSESREELLYTIKANKWLDFSAAYAFINNQGQEAGRVARKGWTSLWKARYEIYDQNQVQDLTIREENGWIKVADAAFGQIPVLGIFTGYFFNPAYIITRANGEEVMRLKKDKSFFGRKFSAAKLAEFLPGEEERIILSLMMMILLERRRG